MATTIYTYENPVSEKDISRIVEILNNDGVICYPSDVNWAFGAKATSKKAIDKLVKLKPNHPKDKPFALVFSSISQVSEYASVDNFAYRHLKKLLPGPYTIILPRAKNLPKQLDDKRRVVGVRVPNRELVLKIIEALEVPLVTSSVPENADNSYCTQGFEIEEKFGHALDGIIELGIVVDHQETTVLDLSEGELCVIREGVGPI